MKFLVTAAPYFGVMVSSIWSRLRETMTSTFQPFQRKGVHQAKHHSPPPSSGCTLEVVVAS